MQIEFLAPILGLAGAAVGGVVQWLVARGAVRAETDRLYKKLSAEFQVQQFSAWQAEFQSVISEFLCATDPEMSPKSEKQRVIPLVLRANLLLNPHLPSHAAVNDLINQLALAVNGWQGEQGMREVLNLHAQLLLASRALIYAPGRRDKDG